MSISEIFFWASLIILIYTYLGYPLFIAIVSKIFPKKILKQEDFPAISFIVAAFNEEKVIAHKLRETLKLDYPLDKLEIIVASDGKNEVFDLSSDPAEENNVLDSGMTVFEKIKVIIAANIIKYIMRDCVLIDIKVFI